MVLAFISNISGEFYSFLFYHVIVIFHRISIHGSKSVGFIFILPG
jgi:hypothetical protein